MRLLRPIVLTIGAIVALIDSGAAGEIRRYGLNDDATCRATLAGPQDSDPFLEDICAELLGNPQSTRLDIKAHWFSCAEAARKKLRCDLQVLWYRLAAKAGDPDAADRLGDFYREGYVVPKDQELAEEWYFVAAAGFLAAAEYDDKAAALRISRAYRTGRGVQQDMDKAYFWAERAFLLGSREAMSELERYHSERLQLVPEDKNR